MQCTTSFLCDSCSQTTTAPAPRSTCFLLCTSRNAKMHACPVPAAGLLCPAMLLLLALLAAPPAVAAVNMSTYGALRVSVVRSAATGLSRSRATRAAYPCRTLTGICRLWISSTRTAPSYIYALYMLMLEHVSSIGDRFRGGGLFVLSPPNFFFLPEHHVLNCSGSAARSRTCVMLSCGLCSHDRRW